MTRWAGFVLIAGAILGGCADYEPRLPGLTPLSAYKKKGSGDPDIVRISLRPLPKSGIAKLPKKRDRAGLSMRLRQRNARLQYELPLLPHRMPAKLNFVARSYWTAQSMGQPSGRFLLRLRVPLSRIKQHGVGTSGSLNETILSGSSNASLSATCMQAGFDQVAAFLPAELCNTLHDMDQLIDGWADDLSPSRLTMSSTTND